MKKFFLMILFLGVTSLYSMERETLLPDFVLAEMDPYAVEQAVTAPCDSLSAEGLLDGISRGIFLFDASAY